MRRCPPGAADPGRITVAARCILAASVLLAYPADPTFTAEAAAAPGPLVTFPDEPGPLVTGPTPRADATSLPPPPPPAIGAAARPTALGDLAVCARVIPATLLTVGCVSWPGMSRGFGANTLGTSAAGAGATAACFAAAASTSKLTSLPAAAVSLYASRWYAAV